MSLWRRIVQAAAATGLVAAAQPVQAQTPVPPASAPAAWVQYAGEIEKSFENKLASDDEAAKRLQVYFASASRGDSLIVGVWVTPDGQVNRVAFAPFLDSQANADLAKLLQGVKMTSNPPKGILLPIRLTLHLGANSAVPSNGMAATPVSAEAKQP
jgi:hypothetical protein